MADKMAKLLPLAVAAQAHYQWQNYTRCPEANSNITQFLRILAMDKSSRFRRTLWSSPR